MNLFGSLWGLFVLLYLLFQLFDLHLCVMGNWLPGNVCDGCHPSCRVAYHAEQREGEGVENLFEESDLLNSLVLRDEQEEPYGDYAEVLEDEDLQNIKCKCPPGCVSRGG